jgi:1-acyl-sn-glycerol-3-phosphate acyltransferase
MYTLVKNIIRFGIFFYFKRVKIYGRDKIPSSGPIVFIGNHPNALIDPLLVAFKNPRNPYFLTRASVFGNRFLSGFFDRIKMLPIYRPRDGKNQMYKNEEIFKKCENILGEGNSLGVFAEGSHCIEKRIRPLKSGFARIVLATLESFPELKDIQLVPIGLNYSDPTQALSEASVYFGDPISTRQVLSGVKDEKGYINALTIVVEENLKNVTTHVSGDNYIDKINYLNSRRIDFTDPESANKALEDFDEKKWNEDQIKSTSKTFFEKTIRGFFILTNLIPYLIWKKLQSSIKDIEFISTFRFAICMTLVIFNLFAQFLILGYYLPDIFEIYLFLYAAAFTSIKLLK